MRGENFGIEGVEKTDSTVVDCRGRQYSGADGFFLYILIQFANSFHND